MADHDDRLSQVLCDLGDRGVQLWHNRGRLFGAPWDSVRPDERRLLGQHTSEVISLLRGGITTLNVSGDPTAPRDPGEGSYGGVIPRKSWDYEVAVVLPTFGSLDLVKAAVACWRNQTVSPYLVVIDTGPPAAFPDSIEDLRTLDCEVHYVRAHAWRHSSSPVAAALDLAFAVCQCDRALLTHVDVFPKRDTVLEELLPRLSPSAPVVGYQMSRRIGSDEWMHCVSHTLTLVDMRVMRRQGIAWNLLAALEERGELDDRYLGWPDTETWFGRRLTAAGIVPEFLGSESNATMYENEYIVHWRSAPSVRHYLPEQSGRRHPGLDDWLSRTRAAAVAQPLPALPAVSGGERKQEAIAGEPSPATAP